MRREVGDQLADVLAALDELVDEHEQRRGVLGDDALDDAQEHGLVDRAEQPAHVVGAQRAVERGRELVEPGDGVAERPARVAGDQAERGVVDVEALGLGDPGDDAAELPPSGAGTRTPGSGP